METEMNFAVFLIGLVGNFLQGLKNKKAQEAGELAAAVDQVTLAVLQENARIKGATIDWADPAQVQAFVATLPTFTPIPEPGTAQS